MDDTTSDPGTFVSIENFITSAAPSPAHFSTGPPSMAEDDARERFSEPVSFSLPPHTDGTSTFMWRMFDTPEENRGEPSVSDSNEGQPTRDMSIAPDEARSAPREEPLVDIDDDEDDVSGPNESFGLGEGDTMTDASDLCVEIDKVVTSPHSAAQNDRQSPMNLSSGPRNPSEYKCSPIDGIPPDFPSDCDEAPLWTDMSPSLHGSIQSHLDTIPFTPSAPVHRPSSAADPSDTPVARPIKSGPVTTSGSDGNNSVHASPGDAHGEFEKAIEEDNKRLLAATSGLASFEIENPFVLSSNDPDEDGNLILFSKKGPLGQDERTAFGSLATEQSPQGHVFARLIETIVFQQKQMLNLKDSAVELSGNALHAETQRFSEVERRRSYAMNALIGELDNERERHSRIEGDNMFLRQQLSRTENDLDEIMAFCKQYDSEFTLSEGVDAAFQSVFARSITRRQSVEQVAAQSNQMENLGSRLLHLDKLLGEARSRSDLLETENNGLRTQLAALEGTSNGEIDTPEFSPRIPTPRESPLHIVTRERDELRQRRKELEDELNIAREFVTFEREEKKNVNEAMLSMNIDLDAAKSRITTLKAQRSTAERELRQVEQQRSIDRKTYHEMCQDLSRNIVEAVNDLDEKESKIRILTKELEDRQSVIQSLQVSVSEFDDQVATLTEDAIHKCQRLNGETDRDHSQVSNLIDGAMRTLRAELSNAQNILREKSEEISELKKRVAGQDELTYSLRRECDRFRSVMAMKTSAVNSSVGYETQTEEQQNAFLERLSEALGETSGNNQEITGRLIARVSDLLNERAGFGRNVVELRSQVLERERTLHVVRSEMQAEISTLKAEVQHLENLKKRAVEQCDFAENKLMELLGERDVSTASSLGDVTSSSLGLRRQSEFSFTGNLSRRESMISGIGADNTIQWNDPLVVAAVQSLDQLTEMKDRLAARYRAQRERLDRMIQRGETGGTSHDSHALMIESRELQEDLSGVVDMQQLIIDKFRPQKSFSSVVAVPGADDTLPYISHGDPLEKTGVHATVTLGSAHGNDAGRSMALSSARSGSKYGDVAIGSLDGVGEATSFLLDQLTQSRGLYSEKLKANAKLCGVVAELKQEIEHVVQERRSTEELLSQASESHSMFVSRLAQLTGAEKSPVAIEDYVQQVVHDLGRLSNNAVAQENKSAKLLAARMQLIAQKHVLSHLIEIYQSKYQLDIFRSSPQESSSARRRFRILSFAVVASIKMARNVSQAVSGGVSEINISEEYNISRVAPIARRRAGGLTLMNAAVAVSAIPRLEAALIEREKKIEELKAALSALENTAPPVLPDDVRNALQTSFAYEADVVHRKQDLTRRLRKADKEKTDLEVRLLRERECRIAAEAKLSRYSEKLANAKKKLSKMNSQADSKERTYKAAIKYLKRKADKAVEDDDTNVDENTDPWVRPPSPFQKNDENEGIRAGLQATNAKSLSILQTQISHAESDLVNVEDGSEEYQKIRQRIQGLHKAVNHLRQTRKTQSQGPTVLDSNVVPEAC